MKNYYVLIMAGGVGSRFWPISRTAHPKQFIDILGTGKTLIQSTYDRFSKFIPQENIFVATNDQYLDLVKEQLPGITTKQVITEPVMRNTAPCIAYAMYKIRQINPDAAVVVAPSDHLILEEDIFKEVIINSLDTASTEDCLITLGIKPSRPDTGYGYIQYTTKALNESFFKVKTFTEKPDLEIAKSFIQSGDFLWNAGIFVWSVKNILHAFALHLPEMNQIFKEGIGAYNGPKEREFIQTAYYQCTNISIDYGIMEKADNVYVTPAAFGWSDLGTWASVYALSEKDYVGNAVVPQERVMMYDSSNCMVHVPKNKLVVLQGLHDFIVVEQNNMLLICPKDEEQSVKKIVADVKERFGPDFI
jgi:mannose-1-phosphate guanylyltransferase